MSKQIQTRTEFQRLAEDRLDEAKALLDLGKWCGAYYLAGYAVELALKACVIKMLMATDAFPEKDFSMNCYTHDIKKLVGLAGLDKVLEGAIQADQDLWNNWALVHDWSEEKRYHRIDKLEAETLYSAIADATHGVFQWIKTHW